MNSTLIVVVGAAASLLLGWDAHAQTAAVVVPAPVVVQPGVVTQPLPAARWTAQQIRQAFDLADTDSDGVLSRAEAQQLSLMPRTFEEMDQNKDGVLARAEYEAAFIR